MSTEYLLHAASELSSLRLVEHSSLFTLIVHGSYQSVQETASGRQMSLPPMTPAAVISAACIALLAASYMMEPSEFDQAIGKAFSRYAPGDRFAACIPAIIGKIPCPE